MRARVRRLRHHVLLLAGVTALAACRSGAAAPPPAAPEPTPPPMAAGTVEPATIVPAATPRDRVEEAYLRSWSVYARAVAALDDSELATAYRGRALELVRAEIGERRTDRRPARVDVDHDYDLQVIDADTATVVDHYVSHQVQIDPHTGHAVEPDPAEPRLEAYTLRRLDGRWFVTEIVSLA